MERRDEACQWIYSDGMMVNHLKGMNKSDQKLHK